MNARMALCCEKLQKLIGRFSVPRANTSASLQNRGSLPRTIVGAELVSRASGSPAPAVCAA